MERGGLGAEMMTRDRELWACANTLLSVYGSDAPAVVAERIGAMILEGDIAGADTWKAIASRMDRLMRGEGLPQ